MLDREPARSRGRRRSSNSGVRVGDGDRVAAPAAPAPGHAYGPCFAARCAPDGERVDLCDALVRQSILLASLSECSDVGLGGALEATPVDLPATADTVRLANAAASGAWPPDPVPLPLYFSLIDLLQFLDAYAGPLGLQVVGRAAAEASRIDIKTLLRALDARWAPPEPAPAPATAGPPARARASDPGLRSRTQQI
eukprot:tig00021440_g21535.t1